MIDDHSTFCPEPAFEQYKDLPRIKELVRTLLKTYDDTIASYAGGYAAPDNNSRYLFKVSEDSIRSALPELQNTRYRRVMNIIHDILNTDEIIEDFGLWVCVSFDEPDYVFIKLPAETTTSLRLRPRASTRRRTATLSVNTSFEPLLYEPGDEDDEDATGD